MQATHLIAGTIVAASAIGTVAYNARILTDAARILASPYRWIKAFVLAPNAVISLSETQASHGRALERIVKELTPNGGLSVRDAIVRIESNSIADRQRNRALLLDVSAGIFEADQTGVLTWGNRTLCRLLERLPDELLGNGWQSYIVADDRERAIAEWNRCIVGGREFVMQLRFIRASAVPALPVNIHTYVLRSDTGQIIGFQGVCRRID